MTTTATLTDAKAAATRRADEIDRQLADLEAERAEAAADVLLGKDGAAGRLSKLAEKKGALGQERQDLGLAVEEIGRREAAAAARSRAIEDEVNEAKRDEEVQARNKLYDEFAALIEKAAVVAGRCLLADENIAKLAHALRIPPEPMHRQSSKQRLHTFIEWKFVEAGFHPEFTWPPPARRVRPRDW